MVNVDFDKVKGGSDGRWFGILSNLGIEVVDDPKQHTACPLCGPGNNSHRFRFDNKNGTGSWICNQCGSGDGILLVMKKFGLDFKGAMEKIAPVIGICEMDEPYEEKPSSDNRKANIALWKSSIPLNGKTPVDSYLRSRGILLGSNAIRYCKECWNAELKQNVPAMVAAVQNPSGKAVSIHRTYLTEDGKKLDVQTQKMLMPCSEKIAGGAIRLKPYRDVLGICEGIETALSCIQIFDIPTWAAVSSTILEGFVPPKDVRKIVVFADNDASFVGQKAAYALANTLYKKDLIVEVLVPDIVGDFNDSLNKSSP